MMAFCLLMVAIGWLVIFLHDVRAFLKLPWLCPMPVKREGLPPVSVLIAARNEADTLATTLKTVMALDYPAFEILLIDDQSSDGTGAVARKLAEGRPEVKVLEGTPPPVGWMGKSWALHQGVECAKGAWFLFTDADCAHHPLSLRCAMAWALANRFSLVSLVPRLCRLSLAEKLSMPAFVVFLGTFFPLARLNEDPNRAFASGGFLLIDRRAYEAVGGHEAIKSSLLDDVSLARRVKAEGFSVWTGLTRQLVTTQQYESFSALWEGLGKHAFEFMGRSVGRYVGFIGGLGVMVGLPLLGLITGGVAGEPLWIGLGTVSMVLMGLLGIGGTLLLGIHWLWGLALPIGLLLYGAIVSHSVWCALRGRLVWSGRRYGG